MTDSKGETIDFGAPEAFGSHVFRVEITAAKTDPIKIIEDFGFKGGTGGIPYEECRVIVPRAAWAAVSDHARRDFNERLRAVKASTGRAETAETTIHEFRLGDDRDGCDTFGRLLRFQHPAASHHNCSQLLQSLQSRHGCHRYA